MQKHLDGNVKVVCRFRPLNAKQVQLGTEVIQEVPNRSTVRIKDPKLHQPHSFNLDYIFDTSSTQEQIYEAAAKPVVSSVLQGFNGTIFAYGQTASGKTHTMQGYNIEVQTNKGIIPRMVEQVFSTIEKSPENIQFRLKVSIVQLYMEKIRDLLDISKQDLKIRSHVKRGIYIEDATQKYVSEISQLYALMSIGNQNRASCSTNMNERSSRSHMVFLITISQTNLTDLSAKTGKLFLVDLAGSEKISKTGAEGQTLNQAKKINLSLTSLGKVIKALTESKGSHIPYRQSKLTRILQESLGGNSKTSLIITCSPHPTNLPETISTLRFGVSAKKVSNKAKINRQMTVGQLQQLLEKAQKQLADKVKIIRILQRYVTDELKASLPPYDEVLKSREVSPKAKNVEPDQSEAQEQESLLQVTEVSNSLVNYQVEERVLNLEKELESYKSNLESQTEKLKDLRLNYNLLHTQNLQIQKENEALTVQVVEAKQDKSRLKKKVEQLQAPRPFLLEGSDKQLGKLILNEVMQFVQPQQARVQLLSSLKCQKWFIQMDNEPLDVGKFMSLQKEKIAAELSKTQDKNRAIEDNNELNGKLLAMECDLDRLYTQYYDVISTQAKWKVECQLYERVLSKKCKRMNELEELIDQLKKELETMKDRDPDTISVFQVTSNRLVKPIRGGNKGSKGSKLFQF